VPDGLLPGLYFVIQPSGAKSWAVRYRHDGKPRKLTIGAFPALTLADARRVARLKLQAAAEGSDPAGEKVEMRRKAKAAPDADKDTFEAVAHDFVERYASDVIAAGPRRIGS